MMNRKTEREVMAKEYDAVSNRLFLVQVLVLCGLLAVFQFSGASQALADGLVRRFGDGLWYVTNAVYTLVAVFGFAAFMSPFSYYSGHVLERHYELSEETTGEWIEDFVRSLGIDLLLATVLFSVIYALLRWIPEWWWLAAALVYILISVVFSTLAPSVIIPRFHSFEELEKGDLSEAILAIVSEADIPVSGVYKWGLDDRSTGAYVTFSGGRNQRKIVLDDSLLTGYSKDEICAIVAQEVGHFKCRDNLRLMVTSSMLAILGFYIAHICLLKLTGYVGVEQIYDIAAAPLFIFCLFVFSLISMPVSNLHSRKREYAADAFAVETLGSPEPLVMAFEKLADQNLSNKEPAPWVEFLLHSHPSMARRIKRVQRH